MKKLNLGAVAVTSIHSFNAGISQQMKHEWYF